MITERDLMYQFIDAVMEVLETYTKEPITQKLQKIHSKTNSTRGITVFVGLVDEVEGRLILDMDRDTAVNLTQRILSTSDKEFDEIARIGIGEFGNWVGGHAITNFEKIGISADITTPTVIFGDEVVLSDLSQASYIVSLETEFGLIVMNVSFKIIVQGEE
jgi:chemotaxis protein CheX